MTRRETIACLSRLRAYCERPDVSDRAARVLVAASLSSVIHRLNKPRSRVARLGTVVSRAMRRIVKRTQGE